MRQILEILLVYCVCRVGPGYYLMAEMGKKQYSLRYKLGFLNGKQYVRRINQINDPAFYQATFNKLIEKSLLGQHSVPTPKYFGLLSLTRGRGIDGSELKSSTDLALLFAGSSLKEVCFKLTSGDGGAGFRKFRVDHAGDTLGFRDLSSSQHYTIDQLYLDLGIASGSELLLEEAFEQHPELSAFNPTSVNTLRIMVYRPTGEPTRCLGAYLRIGRAGKIVDNGSAGGICAKIDLGAGLLEAASLASTRAHKFADHPDSGARIKGANIPLLSEAVSLAVGSLDVFPRINYGVFDVAIGKTGPVIIELNARADYVDFALLHLPSRYALKKA